MKPSTTNPSWNLLGILTNEKPSAIFKLSGAAKKTASNAKSVDDIMDDDGPFTATGTALEL